MRDAGYTRDMNEAEARIKASFTDERTGYIVAALARAYAANVERYQPSIGDDGMNFGLNVYKGKVYFIALLAEHFPWIRVVQRNGYFRFQVDDYYLSTYCAGHVEGIDPLEAFPANRNRAGKLAEANVQQATLWTQEEWNRTVQVHRDDSACRELILNDIGNAADGLLKVFIGVPMDVSDDGKVNGWSTVVELWDRGTSTIDIPPLPFGPDTPPEIITKFQPTLKDQSKTHKKED
jgi:hypothetical protein